MTAAIYEHDSNGRRFAHPRAWCVVDLDAVRTNARALSNRAGVPLVAMVKADAYGLGAVAIARALGAPFADQGVHGFHEQRTTGVALWALGVATVSEAVALREAGCEARIFCCSPLLSEQLSDAFQARLIPSLHRAEDILNWTALGDAPWHLAIDTGINRSGVTWSDAASLAPIIAQHPPQGVYTHFHSAQLDNGSRELQLERFAQALAVLPLSADTMRHAANSFAIAGAHPAQPTDASTTINASLPTASVWHLARPGLSLYGVPANSELGLRPVLHVYARIVDVHDVSVGESVSYDAEWTAQRPSRVATVAVGYGDGYRRALSNVGQMIVGEQRVRVVGNVTMDLTMIDVTDVPCEVGDIVTVLGDAYAESVDSLSVSEVAEQGSLSPYELLVGWRLRLPRVYRESL